MTTEDREFFNELTGNKLNEGFGLEYNLFACEQAILIADALQSREKISEFMKMTDFNSQMKMVPGLSDGHSGNTFGMACHFAAAYLPITHAKIRDGKINSIIN